MSARKEDPHRDIEDEVLAFFPADAKTAKSPSQEEIEHYNQHVFDGTPLDAS